MNAKDYLGEFEQYVLLALLRLGERAYGMRVRQEIEARTERRVAIGAVYTTLERMEAKGYVSSRRGDATPERGGRERRYFRIEAPGEQALLDTVKAMRDMQAGLEPILGVL
jgi:PadR family transcriptional regulator PadR